MQHQLSSLPPYLQLRCSYLVFYKGNLNTSVRIYISAHVQRFCKKSLCQYVKFLSKVHFFSELIVQKEKQIAPETEAFSIMNVPLQAASAQASK